MMNVRERMTYFLRFQRMAGRKSKLVSMKRLGNLSYLISGI